MQFIPQKFPKIPAYKQQADWLHCVNNVVCLEKIDGTNTRIGISKDAKTAGDIVIGGRTVLEDEPKFSQGFICDMIRNDSDLCERLITFAKDIDCNVVLYGETCGASIQKCGIIYGKKIHFVLFAVMVGNIWCSYSRKVSENRVPTVVQASKSLGLPIAPCLYQGQANSEEFTALLDRSSQHSENQKFSIKNIDNTHEGIVIWSDPLLLNSYGEPIVAKYKHPNRREYVHSKGQQSPNDFAQRTVLPERIRHAIEHIKEQGQWQEDFHNNKELVRRRVIQDIAREVEEYQQQISLHSKKNVRKAISSEVEKRFSQMKLEEFS
ncbi:RNA ligase family protein [Candidatus Uabimicrobium sp. HlEnr_7]|uniref:RNA ligase family protein n=1 Tax=Candidatus Uabimicrobium helgolandensis TaxID=3095367 RepID=UPI0035578FCA